MTQLSSDTSYRSDVKHTPLRLQTRGADASTRLELRIRTNFMAVPPMPAPKGKNFVKASLEMSCCSTQG